MFKQRLDHYIDAKLGFVNDLFNRPRFEDCCINGLGTLSNKIDPTDLIEGSLWAWETLPPTVFYYAVVDCGYVTTEELALMRGCNVDEIKEKISQGFAAANNPVVTGVVESLEVPSYADVLRDPLPGETRFDRRQVPITSVLACVQGGFFGLKSFTENVHKRSKYI